MNSGFTKIHTNQKNIYNNRIINQYTVLKNITETAFAQIKLCSANGKLFIAKVFKAQLLRRQKTFSQQNNSVILKSALEEVHSEIRIHSLLENPNILKLFEVLQNEERAKLYLILEYCSNGPLLQWSSLEKRFFCEWHPGYFDNEFIKKIIKEVASGLQYLHDRGVVHCDLKPQNILVCEDFQIKIADFGQALCSCDSAVSRTHGTYHFMSPESISDSCFSGKSSDVWAFGVSLYACVFRVLPFDGDNLHDLMESIEKSRFDLGRVKFPSEPRVCQSIKRILERLLEKDPEIRIGLAELLRDPWVNR